MADLFGISISALQAFQTAISVTGNNIANANTPGYAEETVNLTAATPQGSSGGPLIGSGVDVTSITRSVDSLSNNQLNSSQSSLGQLNSLQTYTNQLDNIIGTTAGGLTSNADRTNHQATTVAAAAEQASANVQTVASTAEELAASIAEIGRQVAQAAQVARKASEESQRTNVSVAALSETDMAALIDQELANLLDEE